SRGTPGRTRSRPRCWTRKTSTSSSGGHTARSARRLETTSHRFAQSDQLLLLAQVAQTWSCRPSDLVQATGTTALQLDIAAAVALWRWQEQIRGQDSGVRG